MAVISDLKGIRLNPEVSIRENGAETSMQFSPGFDDETVEQLRARLLEKAGADDWERVADKWSAISHIGAGQAKLTTISVTQDHFGKFRHNRPQRVLETIGAVLGKTGVSLIVQRTPQDFYMATIADAVKKLSN